MKLFRRSSKPSKKILVSAFLLKRYTEDVTKATPEMIKQAAANTIPQVAPMFWSFRVMIGCGLALLLLYIVLGFTSP